MITHLNRWVYNATISKELGNMLEILLKTIVSLLPFVKEWLFGGPKKSSRVDIESKLLTLKKILILVVCASLVSVVYLVERLWTITRKYEQVLTKDKVDKATAAKPSSSSPAVTTTMDDRVVATCTTTPPTPATSTTRRQRLDDYSSVVKELKDSQ